MKILGIETSCDETSAALLEVKSGKLKLLSNIVSSQIKIHAKFGGVVPEVAAREHVKAIIPIIDDVLGDKKPDLIAAVSGPGLITSLMMGVETAKTLGYVWQVPVIGVNHLHAHIYANWLSPDFADLKKSTHQKNFPLLAVIVSGGHTEFILMKDVYSFLKIGSTLDDAAGEAFDKVAKMLNLGYPGGPIISKRAESGRAGEIDFPRPMLEAENFDFSFSGLKTSVLYYLRKNQSKLNDKQFVADVALAFETAVVETLTHKMVKAAKKFRVKAVVLAGGVAANKRLRETFAAAVEIKLPGVNFYRPAFEHCTDNAAMVAVTGYFTGRRQGIIEKNGKINEAPRSKLRGILGKISGEILRSLPTVGRGTKKNKKNNRLIAKIAIDPNLAVEKR